MTAIQRSSIYLKQIQVTFFEYINGKRVFDTTTELMPTIYSMRKKPISVFKGTGVNPFISVSTYIVQIQDNTSNKILKICRC